MPHLRNKRFNIYQSKWHLLLTMLILIIPFLFLLAFSRFAKIATSTLLLDFFFSLSRMAVAYFIAALLGWLCAVFFYRGKRAAVALPLFDVLQSFPAFAALPLAVFFWGASNFTVIFFLVISIVWPIFFSVISSLKLIKYDWQEAVEIFGLSGFNYWRLFLWPITIPSLITGSVIGLGDGWEALVATEIIVRLKPGLGDFFQLFAHNIPVTIFGILGFLILIFCLNKIIWLPLMEWSHRQMEE